MFSELKRFNVVNTVGCLLSLLYVLKLSVELEQCVQKSFIACGDGGVFCY